MSEATQEQGMAMQKTDAGASVALEFSRLITQTHTYDFFSEDSQSSYLSRLRRTLESGADANARMVSSNEGHLPLHSATTMPVSIRTRVVDLLLEFGADPFLDPAIHGDTCKQPIIQCANRGQGDLVQRMLKAPVSRGASPLHMEMLARECISSVLEDEVFDAVQAHFKLHTREMHPDLALNHLWTRHNESSLTPLMTGAFYGRIDQLSWLLDHPELDMGRHLEDVDKFGNTALLTACASAISSPVPGRKYAEVITRLVAAGASLDVRNALGESPRSGIRSSGNHPQLSQDARTLIKSLADVRDARGAIERVIADASSASAGARP